MKSSTLTLNCENKWLDKLVDDLQAEVAWMRPVFLAALNRHKCLHDVDTAITWRDFTHMDKLLRRAASAEYRACARAELTKGKK